MRPEIQVGDLVSLLDRLVNDFAHEAHRAYAARGMFALAIPGGSVAEHGCPALARVVLDWPHTHVFWVDERAVPPEDPESNFGLAASLWLHPSNVPASSVHRMPADDPDLDAAASAYANELTRILGTRPRLDFVLLGVGPDGHIASLFPGHAAALEERRLALAVVDSPKPPPRRLTLTMPVLATAARIVVMVFGESKAAAMREALEDERSQLPVARVLRGSARALVLLDQGAASLL